ncbi:MAG: efflux RND transporter periplasmic adaptor subunit [Planctomycetota bacterium]
MMNTKFLRVILCWSVGILLLTGCGKKAPPKSNAAQLAKVTVSQPRTETVERIITAVGTLDPEDQVQVAAEVAGLVQEIRFEEGQEVSQGAELTVLNPTNFQLNVVNAQALAERAQADLALAESSYSRKKGLYDKNFITEQELQEMATALDKAKSILTGAEAACQIAEKALADSVIKAPVDANNANYSWEIQKKLVSIGEYVNPGKPIAELINRATLKLRFTVPEQEAGYLALDKPVEFTVPALPGKVFEAKIIYLSPKAIEGTRSVLVKARVDNSELVLRPGYSANVRMVAETKEKALVIPRRSLRYDADKSYVLVVNNGVLNKKTVTLGVEKEDYVEIAAGINPTDIVVVRSSSFLDEGSKVEIVEDDSVIKANPKDGPAKERK